MRIRGYDHDDNKHDCGSYCAGQLYCSDYSVVVSPVSLVTDEKKKTAEEEMLITAAALEDEEEDFSSKKVRLTDVLSVPGFGRIWLFAIAIISAALCIAILMIPGFKQDDFEG